MRKAFTTFFIVIAFVLGVSCENSSAAKYPWQNSIIAFADGENAKKYLVTGENFIIPLDNETELCTGFAELGTLTKSAENGTVVFSSSDLNFSYNSKTNEIKPDSGKITYKKWVCPKSPLAGKTFKGEFDGDTAIFHFTENGLMTFSVRREYDCGVLAYAYDSSKNIVKIANDFTFYYNPKLGTLYYEDVDVLLYDVKETTGKDYFDGYDSKSLVGKQLIDKNTDIIFFKNNIVYVSWIDHDSFGCFGYYLYNPEEKTLSVVVRGYSHTIDLPEENENVKIIDYPLESVRNGEGK